MMGIYMIYSYQNGNYYIGSSSDIDKRKKRHLSHLSNNKHCNIYLQNLYNKYGAELLKFFVIEEVKLKDELKNIEQIYLDILKPKININKYASGGDIISNHPNKELLRKKQIEKTREISKSENLRNIRSINGKKLYPNGIFYGKKHSEKTKLNMRKSRGKKIIINNITYNSYREAEEMTGINRKKLSDDKFIADNFLFVSEITKGKK